MIIIKIEKIQQVKDQIGKIAKPRDVEASGHNDHGQQVSSKINEMLTDCFV